MGAVRDSSFGGALVAALVVALSAACDGGDEGVSVDAGDDAGAAVDGGAIEDAARGDGGCVSPFAVGPGATASAWCEVDRLLTESLASSGIGTSAFPGLAFELYEHDATLDEPVLRYSRAEGLVSGAPASVTAPIPTASAAKMLTALLLARAVVHATDAGDASLSTATTVDTLGCSGVPAGLAGTTLSDLMHQTAGLTSDVDDPCVMSATVPLETCACTILAGRYDPATDGTFAYSPHNFTVAVAIAEHVLARLPAPTTMSALFDLFTGEVGIAASEGQTTRTNNWAGAYRISAHAYGVLLALALPGPDRGSYHHRVLLDRGVLDAMAAPYGDAVTVTYSPYVEAAGLPIRYGFGDWVACSDAWPAPAAWPAIGVATFTLDYVGCPYRGINSLGKFGFMPWLSARAARPYAAVLAVDLMGGAGRVSANSFAAFQMLDPALRAALDAGP